MDSFEKFDEYFKEGLHDYGVKPSAEIWDRMEDSLPTGMPWYVNPYFRGSAIVVLSFLSIGLTYFISNYQIEASIKKIDKEANVTTAFVKQKPTQTLESIVSNPIELLAELPTPDAHKKMDLVVRQASNTQPLSKKKELTKVGQTEVVKEEIATLSVASKETKSTTPLKTSFKATVQNVFPSKFFIANQQLLANKSAFLEPSIEILTLNYKVSDPNLYSLATLPAKSSKKPTLEFDINDRMVDDRMMVEAATQEEMPSPPIAESDVKDKKGKGWYAGTMYQTQSAFLINQREQESEEVILPVQDLDQNTQIGNAYGVVLGYNFGKSTGIQLEWILNSQQNMEFERGNADMRVNQDMAYRHNLNYMLFPVLFKYSKSFQSKLTKNQMSFNQLVGFQYGYLSSAEVTLGGEAVKSDWLNRSNLGLVVGMDYDVYFTRNAHLSLGARSTVAKSIYNIDGLLDNDRLYNVLLGLNASFRYRFNKQ